MLGRALQGVGLTGATLYHTFVWYKVALMLNRAQELALKLSAIGLPTASIAPALAAEERREHCRLSSGISRLDDFFEGGVPLGTVMEWGAPFGQGGRQFLVCWLAQAAKAEWILWVHARAYLSIYPPAWLARGLSLERIRFAVTADPLEDLRPVFLESFFRVIVLDSPPLLGRDECAFLARRARAQRALVILIRDECLDERRGNVWARLRINCWYEPRLQQYRLRVIRGLSPRQMTLAEGEFGL